MTLYFGCTFDEDYLIGISLLIPKKTVCLTDGKQYIFTFCT